MSGFELTKNDTAFKDKKIINDMQFSICDSPSFTQLDVKITADIHNSMISYNLVIYGKLADMHNVSDHEIQSFRDLERNWNAEGIKVSHIISLHAISILTDSLSCASKFISLLNAHDQFDDDSLNLIDSNLTKDHFHERAIYAKLEEYVEKNQIQKAYNYGLSAVEVGYSNIMYSLAELLMSKNRFKSAYTAFSRVPINSKYYQAAQTAAADLRGMIYPENVHSIFSGQKRLYDKGENSGGNLKIMRVKNA